MFNICRHASRGFFLKKSSTLLLARCTLASMQPKPFVNPPVESHDEYNMRIGRPQSPHLAIYAVQFTSLLSISHRLTGAAVTGYVILFSLTTFVLPNEISYYIELLEASKPGGGLMFFIKFMLSFPFCYHFFNGIRHLSWDLGNFLTLPGVYNTGYAMLGATFAFTMLFSII